MKKSIFTLAAIVALALSVPNLKAASMPEAPPKHFKKTEFICLNGKSYEQRTEGMLKFFEKTELYETSSEKAKVGYSLFFIHQPDVIGFPDRSSGEISKLVINKPFQNQGFGSYLLRHAHNRIASHGIRTTYLQPVPLDEETPEAKAAKLPQLRRFYKSHGYDYSDHLSTKYKQEWMERNVSRFPQLSSLFTKANPLHYFSLKQVVAKKETAPTLYPNREKAHERCRFTYPPLD